MAGWISAKLRTKRVLVSTDGPSNNVLKFKPPLCFSLADAARFLGAFGATLAELDTPTKQKLVDEDLAIDVSKRKAASSSEHARRAAKEASREASSKASERRPLAGGLGVVLPEYRYSEVLALGLAATAVAVAFTAKLYFRLIMM